MIDWARCTACLALDNGHVANMLQPSDGDVHAELQVEVSEMLQLANVLHPVICDLPATTQVQVSKAVQRL